MAGVNIDLNTPNPNFVKVNTDLNPLEAQQNWNANVLNNAVKSADTMANTPFDAKRNAEVKLLEEKAKVSIDNSIAEAGIGDKLGAMWDSAKKTNDFSALSRYIDKPAFKADADWISNISDPATAGELAGLAGLNPEDAIKLSKTVSFEDYTHTVKLLQDDMKINNDINHKIGTGLQATGMVAGALTGLDVPLLFLPEIGVGRLATKLDNVYDIYDAVRVEKALASHRAVMNASNISLTAAVATTQTVIHEDYDELDGALSFIGFAGINHMLMNKKWGQLEGELNNITTHLKADTIADKINPQLALPYYINPLQIGMRESEPIIMGMRGTGMPTIITEEGIGSTLTRRVGSEQQGALPYTAPLQIGMRVPKPEVGAVPTGMPTIITEEGIASALERRVGAPQLALPERIIIDGQKTDLVVGNIGKLQERLTVVTKEVDNLTKRLSNPRIGKALAETTAKALEVATAEAKQLTTGLVKIKKAGSFEKAMNEIGKIAKLSGASEALTNTARRLAPNVVKASEQLANGLAKEDIVAIAETVVSKAKGEKLALKTIKGETVVGKMTAGGKFMKFAKQHKLLSALALTGLATANAQAFSGGDTGGDSDFSDYVVYAMIGLIVGGVVTNKVRKVMQRAKGGTAIASTITRDIASTFIKEELQTSPQGEKIGKAYASFNASMIAMGMPFRELYYNGTPAGRKLAQDLLYDPENVGMDVAEVRKKQNVNNARTAYYQVYDKAIAEFAKDYAKTNRTLGDKVRDMGKMKRDFNHAVANAIENKSLQVHPSIRAVAEKQRALQADIGVRAVGAGVKDFRALDDTYFTRITKHDQIFQLVSTFDGGFAKGGKIYDELFDNYVRMYSSMHPSATADAVNAVVQRMLDGIADADNRNIRGGVGDILGSATARAMERIPLNMSAWKDISVTVKGVPTKITLDTVFARDAEEVFLSYLGSMEGHIALAEKGYKSFTDALKVAGDQQGEVANTATIIVNNLIERVNYDSTTTLAQASKAVSNATMPIMMSASAIMQIKELGGTIIRASSNFTHMKVLVNELVNVLRNRGSDDAITDVAIKISGQGTTIMGNKLHTRSFEDGVDTLLETDESVMSLVRNTGMKIRDASMIVYGVAPITDWAQRVNARVNLDKIARLAFGKITMSRNEMQKYGITEELLEMARGVLKVNEKGFLTASSAKIVDENPKLYDNLRRVVFNMGQTQMVSPMQGTSLAMFSESALGAASGNLMSFAFNAYATYGVNMVKGLSRGDGSTMLDTVMWFSTMYLAQELKDAAKGKERTEEEKVRMALMQMPLSAPLILPSLLGGSDIQAQTANELVTHTQSMATLLVPFSDE